MMSNFYAYLLEASLMLTVLYGGYYFVLRDKAQPLFNRIYLLTSLLAGILIPLLHIPLQASTWSAAPIVWQPASQAWNYLPELVIYADKGAGTADAWVTFHWLTIFGCVYFGGLLISLALTIRRILSLRKLLNSFPFHYSEDKSYQLAPTGGRFPTFSFLHYVFWDDTAPLNEREAQQIIRHEEAHVKQKHSYDLLLLEFLTAFLWFNPLLYFYRHSLQQVHEHLADHYVLQQAESAAYLKLMVKQSLRQANIPLVSTFFQHNTLNRIRMIQTKPSRPILRGLFGLTLAFAVFFVVACEEEADTIEREPLTKELTAADHLATESKLVVVKTPNAGKVKTGKSESGEKMLLEITTPETIYTLTSFKDAETFKKAAEIVEQLDPEEQDFEDKLVDKLIKISGETLQMQFQPVAQEGAFPESIENPAKQKIPDEQIFEVVEEQPRPVGGMDAFYTLIENELKYPAQAKRLGVEGRVFVQFVVHENGKVSDVRTVKGIGAGADAEAIRVIKQTRWEPGRQKGQAVKVRMVMPILFKL